MYTAVTLVAIVVPGNNAVLGNNVVLQGLVHAAEKALAVDGIDVGGPDQRPEDGQNPSYARQTGFAQYHLQPYSVLFSRLCGRSWGAA
jgi:hypothetical protein